MKTNKNQGVLFFQEHLDCFFNPEIRKIKTIDSVFAIINAVSFVSKISVKDLKHKKRDKEISMARHAVHYYCKKTTVASLNMIGCIFNKTTATVLNSCKVYQGFLDIDSSFLDYDKQIRMRINLITRESLK